MSVLPFVCSSRYAARAVLVELVEQGGSLVDVKPQAWGQVKARFLAYEFTLACTEPGT